MNEYEKTLKMNEKNNVDRFLLIIICVESVIAARGGRRRRVMYIQMKKKR